MKTLHKSSMRNLLNPDSLLQNTQEGGLPVMHTAIFQPSHREIRRLVGEPRRQRLIYINAVARSLSRMHIPILERIRMREHLIRLRAMWHMLLYPEVGHAQIEVQRRPHADR